MKQIFNEKDIICGMFLIKNTSPRKSENLGFASTVMFKLGFLYSDKKGMGDNGRETKQQYCLISIGTDGWTHPIGYTKKEVCDFLNNGNSFRMLKFDEFVHILSYQKDHLFY